MPDPRDSITSQGNGGKERRCAYRYCKNGPRSERGIISAQARADKKYCDDLCRNSENRHLERETTAKAPAPLAPPVTSPLPAAPAIPPSPAERLVARAQEHRRRQGLPPLVLCPVLSARAHVSAVTEALERQRVSALLNSYELIDPIRTAVLPESEADEAGDLRALVHERATHLGVALLPIGEGEVALALIVARTPERAAA